MNSLLKSHPVYSKRNKNIIQYTGHSLRVLGDWLVTAGKLIAENNPEQKKPKKKYILSINCD